MKLVGEATLLLCLILPLPETMIMEPVEQVEPQEPVETVEPDHLFAVKCLSMSTALLQAYFVSLLPSLIQLSWSGVEPVEQVGFQEPVEADVKVQKVDLIRSFCSEKLLVKSTSCCTRYAPLSGPAPLAVASAGLQVGPG